MPGQQNWARHVCLNTETHWTEQGRGGGGEFPQLSWDSFPCCFLLRYQKRLSRNLLFFLQFELLVKLYQHRSQSDELL